MATSSHPGCDQKPEHISLERAKTTLIKSTKLLCDNLRPDSILLTLQAEQALKPDDVIKIGKNDTDSDKVKALLDILIRSPVSSYEVFMRELKKERPDLYDTVKATEKDKTESCNAFDLEQCQEELIDFYKTKMGNVYLLPWFVDDARNMDDIYVSLELENDKKVLNTNEDLVTIKKKDGTPAKRILVKGLVGSGKSTLMAKLSYIWSQRNPSSPLYKYDLVFMISFREIQEGCSIVDAIKQQILPIDTKVSEVALETFISLNPNVLFLVDGFDEYFAENLDIVQGEIDAMLKFQTCRKVRVIVTSRPYKHLGNCQSFYTNVVLSGFSSPNVKLYLCKFFNNHAQFIDGLIGRLSESENLKHFSHTPVLLMLMCLLWKDSESLPKTQSELYAEFTEFLWKKFCQRCNTQSVDDDSFKNFLITLGKVAFHGLMPDSGNEKLVFCEADFSGSFNEGCEVGLLTKERLRSKLRVSSAVTFLHKSFQEYCASYYLASLPDNQFGSSFKRIDTINKVKSNFEILKFLCGPHAPDYAARTIHHVIQVYLANITGADRICTSLLGASRASTLSIEPILDLLQESNFPSCNEYLIGSLGSLLSAGKEIEPMYTPQWSSFLNSPLATTLNQVHSSVCFNFDSCSADGISDTLIHMPNVNSISLCSRSSPSQAENSTEYCSMHKLGLCIGRLHRLSTFDLECIESHCFTPIIRGMTDNCTFQLHSIVLSYSDCDDDTLCNLLVKQHQLQNLKLIHVNHRASILDAVKAPLCRLTIYWMHVGNAISHIQHIIPHLHCLKLCDTGLQEKDIFTLGEFFPNAKHLTTLDLSVNTVGKAIHSLGCIIPQLHVLNLQVTHLNEDDISTLSEFMKEATYLTELNLSDNNMANAGGIQLYESLKSCSNLTVVKLSGTGIRQVVPNVESSLKESLSNLKYIDVRDVLGLM